MPLSNASLVMLNKESVAEPEPVQPAIPDFDSAMDYAKSIVADSPDLEMRVAKWLDAFRPEPKSWWKLALCRSLHNFERQPE
jgi:hypothetical protein